MLLRRQPREMANYHLKIQASTSDFSLHFASTHNLPKSLKVSHCKASESKIAKWSKFILWPIIETTKWKPTSANKNISDRNRMRLLMNFKHCTQDEIYPTRYLVLQVIDIAKPHCHLSSEAESLWVFFALSYVVHIIKEISFQVLFVVVSIRSIPFFAGGFGSNLYLYSKWNMAAETNFCLKLLLLRCCFTVKTKFYACKLHKQHIWGTNDEPFF